MRATSRLWQACRITLFTRENCGLCTKAKTTLSTVWDDRPFVYREVDIIKPEAKAWRDLYDFDVPVIHVSRADTPEENPHLSSRALKLMHRFTSEEIQAKMDAAEES